MRFLIFLIFSLPLFAKDYGMQEAICRNTFHFQDCFEWSHGDCLSEAQKGLKICLKIMPKQPIIPNNNILKDLENHLGAGRWGVDFAHCGELALYKLNESKLKKSERCESYFKKREFEAHSAHFGFSELEKEIKQQELIQKNTLLQILIPLLLGLILPALFLTNDIFKKSRADFPWRRIVWLYIPLSFIGYLAGFFILRFIGIFLQALSLHGDNPSVIGGIMIAFFILVPAYWIQVGVFYFLYKKKKNQ